MGLENHVKMNIHVSKNDFLANIYNVLRTEYVKKWEIDVNREGVQVLTN